VVTYYLLIVKHESILTGAAQPWSDQTLQPAGNHKSARRVRPEKFLPGAFREIPGLDLGIKLGFEQSEG